MKTRRTPEERKRLRKNPKTLNARKYLDMDERRRFQAATAQLSPKQKVFAEVIYYTGCRTQEAHELCPDDFKLRKSFLSFECLKLREDGVFRHVPVPSEWIKEAARILEIKDLYRFECVWDFSISTGFRAVKKAMKLAKINRSYAHPRGLRHSFCTLHKNAGTDPDLLQYWAGHRNPKTTEIYIEKMTSNEHKAAKALW